MDARTRKRLLGKASLLMHLIQEHHGAIPAGADYADVYREGLDAINALALPVVVRHAAVKKNHRLQEIVRNLSFADEHFSVSENWPVVEGEQWGIGRGLPTGDAL